MRLLTRSRIIYFIVAFVAFQFATIMSLAQLKGNVFKDFNSNGKRDLTNEVGVGGILVTAFTNNGSVNVKTLSDGSYSFSATQLPPNTPVRVEFSELNGYFAGTKGSQSNSAVLFINTGVGANASLGILEPNEYCDFDELSILTTCYVNGDPLGGGSAGEDVALVTFPYDATGLAGQNGTPAVNYVAKVKEVGSAWGLTYQSSSKTFLVSALVRRHSGLGPLGTGGIYKVDNNSGQASQFIDVQGAPLNIDTGADPHVNLPADKLVLNEDSLAIHAAAKTGIGSMSLSQDQKTLYFVNLFDKKLYSFEVGVPMTPPADASSLKSYDIPDPMGLGEHQPWAVSTYRGDVYVGLVNSAEISQDTSKLKAYVYKLDVGTGLFSEVISIPMSYKKGSLDVTGACINVNTWRAWSDVFPQGCAQFFNGNKVVNFAMNPQPILSTIGFDTDGSILLGFMDRFGLFSGYRNMRPKDDGMLYDGFVGGDILRAQYDPSSNDFTLESNGKSGTLTGVGAGNGEGPGGGEFFGDDVWKFFGEPAHKEITNGGVLVLFGLGEIIVSTMDPVDEIYQSGGIRTFSNTDGSMLRSFALYSDVPGTLGKSGGVGDLKIDCKATAIEIGNRIWYDKNFNGIQDPDETGVDGVTVELYDMDDNATKVSTITTQNDGNYYFNPINTPSLAFYRNYEIRFVFDQDAITDKQFKRVSPKDNDPSENGDERDSDGELITGVVTIPINSGFPGQTAHKYDVGLIKCDKPDAGQDISFCAPRDSTKLTDATTGQKWSFVNGPATAEINAATGKITGMTYPGEYKFALVFEPAGLDCSDTIQVTIKPLPDGGQDFAGTDAVCLDNNTVQLTAVTPNGNWTATDTNPTFATIDTDGNIVGLTAVGMYTFIYELDQCIDSVKVEIKDCSIGQIGDFVWADTNDNGIQDNGENGVKDVTVELYKVDNQGSPEPTPFKTVTTGNNGEYLFDKLPSGNYKVKFVSSSLPSGTEISAKQGLGNTAKNSDANPLTGFTDVINIDNNTTLNIRLDMDAAIKTSCAKPNAGNDVTFCAPQSTYKLTTAPSGYAWRQISNQSSTNLNTSTGQISGMSASGDYTFALEQSNLGTTCADTIKVTRKVKPNAGNNITGADAICTINGQTTLNATPTSGTWTMATTNPNGATINSDGEVTGMQLVGFYEFIYTANQCSDTVRVQTKDCSIGQIGDFVWADTNDNGIQDNGENGVKDVTVRLYKVDNQGSPEPTPFKTVTTGNNGEYLFDKLPSGNYKVKFVSSSLPSGTEISAKQGLGNTAKNSDANPLTGFTDVINIDNNTTLNIRLDMDAAIKTSCAKPNAGNDVTFCAPQSTYKLTTAPSGYAWRQISNQSGVNLDASTGQINGMSASGDYTFALEQSNLGTTCADAIKVTRKIKPNAGQDLSGSGAICTSTGTVKLTATPTGGAWSVTANNTATVDNNGNVSGLTTVGFYEFIYTLNECSDVVKVEAIDCTIGKIGDFVWLDINDNGIQDNNELGVEGVRLQLCRVDANGNQIGNSIADATTGTDGYYLFDNLKSDRYRIKIITSSLPADTAVSDRVGKGTNTGIDSDFNPQTLSSDVITVSSTSPIYLNVDAALIGTCVPNECVPVVFRGLK
jgi:hypothetical protein